jgi:hypothetical protein
LIQVEEVRQLIRNRASFFLPAGFVAVMPKRSLGLGDELGAAALDEIAGFGDDVLLDFDQFPNAGLAINNLSS